MTGTSRALKLAKARVMGRTTNAAAAAAPGGGAPDGAARWRRGAAGWRR